MRLSLYVHFPFCLKKCLYCDFNSQVASELPGAEYAALVVREMELAAPLLPRPHQAATLYFGGGTPSLLEPDQVARIVEAASRLFHLENDAEITLEANPGTLDLARAKGFRQAGVNRISLGIQALEDRLLARLGRIHTAQEALDAVDCARRGGFENLSIDLMHSLPEQSLSQWEETLEQAISLGPEHISAYALTVEEGTPFALLEQQGKLPLPEEETGARMFETTTATLSGAGFEPYEISNFARPGFSSRHNRSYWTRGSYLGFGAGAHSFLNPDHLGERWHNADRTEEYLFEMRQGIIPVRDRQRLTRSEAISEAFFLGLRLLEGVDLSLLLNRYGGAALAPYLARADGLIAQNLLQKEGDTLRLAPHAVILANRVFAEFL